MLLPPPELKLNLAAALGNFFLIADTATDTAEAGTETDAAAAAAAATSKSGKTVMRDKLRQLYQVNFHSLLTHHLLAIQSFTVLCHAFIH